MKFVLLCVFVLHTVPLYAQTSGDAHSPPSPDSAQSMAESPNSLPSNAEGIGPVEQNSEHTTHPSFNTHEN